MYRNAAKLYLRSALIPAFSLLGSGPALAQNTAGPDSSEQSSQRAAARAPSEGEIVVTATRRSETINRVPLSVTAFDQASMDTLSVKEVSDIARITPGVIFRPSFGGSTNISVRGITTIVGAATTGIYIDDTPIQARQMGTAQSATNVYPTVFDLERIEALRGPQGTLFGSGSEGGTIRFITPEPNLRKYSAYARGEFAFTEHGDPSYEGGAAIGGPLIQDKIGFRLSAFYRRDGGYVDRVPLSPAGDAQSDSNYATTLAIRGALTFAATENLTITPSLFYQRRYRNDTDMVWLNSSDLDNGTFRNGFMSNQPYRDRFLLPSLKVEWNIGPVSIFSSSSYYDRKYPFINNYSTFILDLLTPLSPGYTGESYYLGSVPGYNALSYNFGTHKSLTQEVRIQSNTDSPLSWVVGGFYQHSRQRFDQYVYDPLLPAATQSLFGATPGQVFGVDLIPAGFGGVPGGNNYSAVFLTDTLDTQIAGFAQLEYSIADSLKLTAGARISKTEFEFLQSKSGAFNGAATVREGNSKESPITPKFGISYEPMIGQLFYATAAKGFRPGGANSNVTSLCNISLAALGRTQVPADYTSDSVWSYEVGMKNRLGSIARIEASAFYIDWKNIQQQVLLGSCGFDFIANLGAAVSKGFDLQLNIQPVKDLSLDAKVSYTNARYSETSYAGSAMQGLLASKGDPLPVPKWHITTTIDYEADLTTSLRGYVHGDYQYESGYPTLPGAPAASYDPLLYRAEPTHFASIRVGVRNDSLDASVFVKNLFNSVDQLYRTRNNINSELLTAATYRPRTLGLTVSYRY